MNVDMVHGLSAVRPIVDHYSESVSQLLHLRDFSPDAQQVAEQLVYSGCVEFAEISGQESCSHSPRSRCLETVTAALSVVVE